jgi:hypothetical protein
MLVATVQNLVASANWQQWFVQPWFMLFMTIELSIELSR